MIENIDRGWIQTYTNKKFYILNPRPEDICIEDVAHALSMQCRFTGHTKFHYSVAQHCVLASTLVTRGFELEALLHDASEAYICDMNRPMKYYTTAGAEYLKVEAKIEAAIARKFGLPMGSGEYKMSPCVKNADNMMLYAEKEQLMMPPREWDTRWGEMGAAKIEIRSWTTEFAEKVYLDRFRQLTEGKPPCL